MTSTDHTPAAGPAGPEERAVEWRRVHKITPALNAWKAVAAVLAVLAWQSADQLTNLPQEARDLATENAGLVALAVLGVVVLVALVTAGYSLLAWRRMRFAVTDESVDLHTGILFRQERHARLIRVQAVDVVQPLLGRLFGLAQVRVETAGSGESNVVIGYLAEAEARALRDEVVARAGEADLPAATRAAGAEEVPGAAGLVPGADGAGAAGAHPVAAGPVPARPTEPAVERELLEVPPGRLVASLLLSASFMGAVLGVVGLLVVAFVILRDPSILLAALPGLVGAGSFVWGRFAGEFGFRVGVSREGVRLRHGLLETRNQTLPPGRVQAVSLSQPFLWRRRGWWRVEVNVAGYGGASEMGSKKVETVLLPVGPRGDALSALWLVLPDLGTDDVPVLLDAALEGAGEGGGFLTSPRRARLFDPLAWRRNGLTVTRTALLIRTGRISRHLAVVPHERTQSLGLTQGPWERRRRLANLHAHSVPGPVTPVAHHLDDLTGLRLLREQAARARTARAAEDIVEWRRRVGVETAAAGAGPALG